MTLFYILLCILMVLDCAILIFLVLLQLPKKEAGAGMAFGGGATDALFGAGSGNVLTKITKYSVAIFFILGITLTWTTSHIGGPSGAQSLTEALSKSAPATLPGGLPPATTPVTPTSNSPAPQMQLLTNLPPAAVPAAPGTNK